MKSDFTKLAISFCIVCAIVIAADFATGLVCEKVVSMLPDFGSQTAKNNYRLNRMTSDIVIIGSSRVNHHYVTGILKDSITSLAGHEYTVYNAGIDGYFVSENSCAIESLLKRYAPRLLIFEVSDEELTAPHDKTVSGMMHLAPFYRSNATVKDYFSRLGWKERTVVQSNMCRFNRSLLTFAKSFFMPEGDSTGYEPLFKKMSLIPAEKETSTEPDPYCTANFSRALDCCRADHIPVVVVVSPKYMPKKSNERIRKECESKGIPFIDMMDTDEFNENPSLFNDPNHLNDEGAKIYTKLFFGHLKPFITGLL